MGQCRPPYGMKIQKTDEPLGFVRFVYYRCRTRSLISWVLPWFQYWVPM